MSKDITLLMTNITYIIIPLLGLIVIWMMVLTFLLVSSTRHYRRLTKNSKNEDLVKIWEEYLGRAQANNNEITNLKLQITNLEKEAQKHFQKVSVVRFNPFSEAGGNQSFALSLLDENGDGVLLSSLHGRDLTRVYAKPVKNFGPGDFEFSKEEEEALLQARNGQS